MRQKQHISDLRIASYNMRKARGLDRRRDPERILRVINGLEAQVVALQEADRRLGARPAALSQRLIEAESDFRVVPVAVNGVSLGWHGNALLVHKSLDVAQIRRIDLPGLEPRGAVAVTLGGDLTLVATHLGLLRQHRRLQLKAITAAIAPDAAAVIVGDFNEWRMDRGLEPLTGRFDVLTPGHSFHAARPVAALDRLAHTRALSVRDAGVDLSDLARRASDHLPIWADFQLDPVRPA